MLRNLALVVTVIGLPASLAADVQQGHSGHSLHRLTAGLVSDPIVVDGRLTEPAWNQAVAATNFIQSEPNEGEPATEQTEVKLLTDGTTLYIGFSAYDTQADEIVVGELKKDFNPRTGDAFEVIIDTFLDRRNGYMFATNPMGAKWDAQMMNEGREVNSDWDAIWRTGAHIDANGWYAERRFLFIHCDFQTLIRRPGVSISSGDYIVEKRKAIGRRYLVTTESLGFL